MIRKLLPLLVLTLVCAAPVLAADAPPDANATLAQAITVLTPVLIPVLVWGAKKGFTSIPSALLPILATALGVALDYVNQLVTGGGHGVVVGALLGMGGVGLREILDQTKKAVVPPDA